MRSKAALDGAVLAQHSVPHSLAGLAGQRPPPPTRSAITCSRGAQIRPSDTDTAPAGIPPPECASQPYACDAIRRRVPSRLRRSPRRGRLCGCLASVAGDNAPVATASRWLARWAATVVTAAAAAVGRGARGARGGGCDTDWLSSFALERGGGANAGIIPAMERTPPLAMYSVLWWTREVEEPTVRLLPVGACGLLSAPPSARAAPSVGASRREVPHAFREHTACLVMADSRRGIGGGSPAACRQAGILAWLRVVRGVGSLSSHLLFFRRPHPRVWGPSCALLTTGQQPSHGIVCVGWQRNRWQWQLALSSCAVLSLSRGSPPPRLTPLPTFHHPTRARRGCAPLPATPSRRSGALPPRVWHRGGAGPCTRARAGVPPSGAAAGGGGGGRGLAQAGATWAYFPLSPWVGGAPSCGGQPAAARR